MYDRSIKSSTNQQIIKKLVDEVKGLNPSFEGHDIRGNFVYTLVSVVFDVDNFFYRCSVSVFSFQV